MSKLRKIFKNAKKGINTPKTTKSLPKKPFLGIQVTTACAGGKVDGIAHAHKRTTVKLGRRSLDIEKTMVESISDRRKTLKYTSIRFTKKPKQKK